MIFSTVSNNSNVDPLLLVVLLANVFFVRIGKLLKITKTSIEH